MRKTINYYYNLDIDEIDEMDGIYHFFYQNNDYYFVYCNRLIEELNEIVELSKYLKIKNIDCHTIIYNKDNSILTKVGDNKYILLQVNNKDEEYDIFAMNEINKKVSLTNGKSRLYRNNWVDMWMKKNDYYEYQIRELGLEKYAIISSFSYYLGLSENAISYANKVVKTIPFTENDKIVLANRRVKYPNIKLNYLNPLSFIFDLEVRNIAEYLKSMFFSDDSSFVLDELSSYLKIRRLSIYSYHMLYARLLYPSYYFDIYDDILNKDINENELLKIIQKAQDYEFFLKKAYLEISKYAKIEKIDWIINQH